MLKFLSLFLFGLQANFLVAQCGTIASAPPFQVTGIANTERGGGAQFVIPVLVHVYYSDVTQPVTAQQIVAVIDAANEDLRGTNPDIGGVTSDFNGIIGDLSIELRLASLDENGNCTSGIDYIWFDHTQGITPDINLGSQNTTNYLNIHIYPASNSQSSIVYPGMQGGESWDSIVLSTYDAVSNIRNLAHEVGHWVGLLHTFGNTNTSGVTCDDDFVLDTPISAGSIQQTCDTMLSVCTPGIIENVQNIMDYSSCPLMFTQGQEARAIGVLLDPTTPRGNHYSASNLDVTGVYLSSTCAIETDMWHRTLSGACDTAEVQYWSMVSGQQPDQVEWSFPGGFPSTSNAPNVSVAYTTSGTYSAQLFACYQGLCDTTSQTFNVTVLSGGSNGLTTINPLPFTEDFENEFAFQQPHMIELHSNVSQWQPCNFAGHASANSVYVPAEVVTTNDTATFLIGNFDFSNTTNPTVQFNVAGTAYSFAWWHKIQILFRDLCNTNIQGAYWHVFEQNEISGGNSATNFIPTSDDQWVTVSASFPSWVIGTRGEVGIRVVRTFQPSPPTMPEAVYLDDLSIGDVQVSTAVEDAPLRNGIRVFPNPASDQVRIVFEGVGLSTTTLLDATGRQVLKQQIQLGMNDLDVADLPRGMYVLEVWNLDRRSAHKVLLH